MYTHIKLFSDGGSRGNPGPAAIAYVIQLDNGLIQSTYSRFIGFHTNNQAEYLALIAGLKSTSNKYDEITCYLDSQLVVKQVNGEYSVRNDKLRSLWNQVQKLKTNFKRTNFISVPRTNPVIQKADCLLNEKLDQNT